LKAPERGAVPPAFRPQRVLGLDPGSRIAGYAVVDLEAPGRFRYRECGTLALNPRAELPERLLELATELRAIVREFAPGVAAVEDVFQQKYARAALVLGQARGVTLLVAAEAGLAVHAYPPATVKRTVCGSGRADKEQVQRMVAALTGLARLPSVDAADALAIALCHCLHAPAVARGQGKGGAA
jgi:crossover junction endodeoxyribonuclease RuvC